MSQYEIWYFIRDGGLYEHRENDGHQAMRKGLQPIDVFLCHVKDAKEKYPTELAKAYYE